MSLTKATQQQKLDEIFEHTYGEDAISDSNCRKWFARFRDGDRSLEDHEREGRPKIVDRDALKKKRWTQIRS